MSNRMRTYRVSFTYQGMKTGDKLATGTVKATSRSEAQRTKYIEDYIVLEIVTCNEI